MSVRMEPKELNNLLFSILNQLSLEEFQMYTNFPELMQTILGKCTKQQLDIYIEWNFKKTVPNKDFWHTGAFASVKLSEEFYKSGTAVRIFRKVFGIRECQVTLTRVDAEILSIIDLSNVSSMDSPNRKRTVEFLPDARHTEFDQTQSNEALFPNKKMHRKLRVKYPRKTMTTEKADPNQFRNTMPVLQIGATSPECLDRLPANNGFDADPNLPYLQQSKTTTEHHLRLGVPKGVLVDGTPNTNEEQFKDLLESARRDEHVLRKPAPMTVIPFENVAYLMDKSDIYEYFRKTFNDDLKQIKILFERYITATDLKCLSLENFWNCYFRVWYGNDAATENPPIQTQIKLEDALHVIDEVDEAPTSVYVPGYMSFESRVEVSSSPARRATFSNNNYQTNYQPPVNDGETRNSVDLDIPSSPTSSRLASVACEKKTLKRPSSNVCFEIAEKRRRSADDYTYQHEFCTFLQQSRRVSV